ncbi:MAG: hypothetical protein EAZ78_05930 [Oscillatoriales cyanobacterium]|uniref:CHAT domain-containing protein n=1 Tax=Microcoleus anatoxicus PTRS2 TaxID=2705321 RepID=A0ABU8YKH8_9CYAN|nr:MAG: hypothetical protein EAZ96_12585 [Oscillatoriales cyanobacterium]TAF05323.1 MAG: hypothetical protein EAZ78_05930 [Oscillatoriales cyanobacterium]
MTRKIYSREVFPLNWARTQHNLGNAYRDRIFGDETENIKQGLAFYHNALEVFTPEEFPEDWARTKNNLAMAYAQWIGELKLDSESTQGIKGFLESYDSDEKPFESPFYWAAFCAIGE